MHTQEENEILTHAGPDTPLGKLLRRYWTPACLSSEIRDPDGPPLRVTLLHEPLIAFRDTEGKVGLIGENCPHRGTSLFFARNEDCGLRCPYHGWKFDTSGQCVDQPAERRSFASSIQATAYPTHESGGIVWTYMGPKETMTPFRDFGTEALPAEKISANKMQINCNWLQSFDGDLDAVHTSWLHSYFAMGDIEDDGTDEPGVYPSHAMNQRIWWHDRAPALEVEDEWYGFRYGAIRNTPNGNTHVRTYAYVMPYTSILAGIPLNTRQIMIVPRDDTSAWRFTFETQVIHNPHKYGGRPRVDVVANYPYNDQGVVVTDPHGGLNRPPYTFENDYAIDRDSQKNVSFTGIPNFRAHDLMVTESMSLGTGLPYDRTKEHWGTTDVALIRMHALLLEAAAALEKEGKEPPAVAADLDYRSIRAAEKVLDPGQDWRTLGTDADPAVEEEKSFES